MNDTKILANLEKRSFLDEFAPHYKDVSNIEPLRLSGGRPSVEEHNLSPILACREIFNEFDNIINAYKKAIGPCGQAVCSYAPNIAALECQRKCLDPCTKNIFSSEYAILKDKDIDFQKIADEVPLTSCGAVECPFTKPNNVRKGNQIKAACGKIQCAYTKFKVGMVDDDATFELKNLPNPTSGYCGKPCRFPAKPPDLPPIHWDCPEPLPKGTCANPNCPYLPPDLRALQMLVKKGPCGSPSCTHIFPSPKKSPCSPPPPPPCPFIVEEDYCGSPDCPFKPESLEDFCGSPECPFAPKPTQNQICDNPECPFQSAQVAVDSFFTENPADMDKYKGVIMVCANPNCPYKKSKDQEKPKGSICSNPTCPIAEQQKISKYESKCSITDCPYDKMFQEKHRNAHYCTNPDCPFATRPQTPLDNDICDNPDCPYAYNKNSANEPDCQIQNNGVCDNHDCPYANSAKINCENKEVCENTDCPFVNNTTTIYDEETEDDICDNPDCPYAEYKKQKSKVEKTICDDPNCPYLQPLPSCGLSLCPFDEVTPSCGIQKCPYDKLEKKEVDVPPNNENAPRISTDISDTSKKSNKSRDSQTSKTKTKTKEVKVKKKLGKYPGVKIGHRDCLTPTFHVPRNMGWLWNVYDPTKEKPRKGFRPGAVDRRVAKMIKNHKKAKELEVTNADSFKSITDKQTLTVSKKDGAYTITVNPLKDPKDVKNKNDSVYMDCTPLQFKIVKKPKETDYKTCICDGDENILSSSSSSDDSMEIEFSPPAAKKNIAMFQVHKAVKNIDTQYDANDFKDETKKGGKEKGKKGKK